MFAIINSFPFHVKNSSGAKFNLFLISNQQIREIKEDEYGKKVQSGINIDPVFD